MLRLLKLKDEVVEDDRTRYNLILRNVTIVKKFKFIDSTYDIVLKVIKK